MCLSRWKTIFLIAYLEKYETVEDEKYNKIQHVNLQHVKFHRFFWTRQLSFSWRKIISLFLFIYFRKFPSSSYQTSFYLFWYETNTCVDLRDQMKSTFVLLFLKIVIKEDDERDIRRSYFVVLIKFFLLLCSNFQSC